jgi:chemotaxis protein methyltransferase CheR
MRPALSEREYRLLSEWLSERSGIRFGPEKRDILRSRLEPRRAELGLETFEEMYLHLKFHPDREKEWERLVPHLTNNESYFFRETGQLDVLRDEVLAKVRAAAEARGRREIRILSAGCAAGEEPYTLAMVVKQSGLFPAPWRVRITGADLDTAVLERARRARYTQNAFRRTDDSIRRRYFKQDGDAWTLSPEITSMVEFRQANLVSGRWAKSLPPQDIVFCRNVLIYFDDESMRGAIENLYGAMAPGGYLFLGHAESLSRIPTRLRTERRPGAIFYQHPSADV